MARADLAALRRWPSGAPLEDDERDLAVRGLLVAAVAAVGRDGLRPQAGALVGAGDARVDRSMLAADLHRCVGVRAQVVIPGGVLRMAALGGDDDNIAPVLDVDQRRGAPSPALGADAGRAAASAARRGTDGR